MKNYKEATTLINKLNSIYRQLPCFGYKTDKEMIKKFPMEHKKFKELSKDFDTTLSALREMGQDAKFDTRGCYYLKYDEKGRERFLVHITKTYETYDYISGANAEIAKKKALIMATRGEILLSENEMEATVGNF